MRKLLLSFVTLLIVNSLVLSQESGYKFTDVKRLPASSVKNQYRSGTCWSFSGIAYLESEMIRMGKKNIPDLSEMFVVRHCYADKAVKTVRLHGNLNFGPGGAFHDVLYVIKNYGIVPEEAYSGLNYGEDKHIHGEIDKVLKSYVDGVVENKNRKLSTAWLNGFNGILDSYFGIVPQKFQYQGKEYTPKSFAAEVVGINPDDYVQVGSYTHHPFYSTFAIEVPDNWLWGPVYNLPLNEFAQIFDYAIDKGFTVGWAADVSEKGFAYNKGIAVVPTTNLEDLSDSEKAKWEKLTNDELQKSLYNLESPGKEMAITQELRQKAFDNFETTDDHGMQIVGIAKDQNGSKYYIVKNSWGDGGIYKGYFYASEAFVLYKTLSIMVHKESIPKEIRAKLKI